MKGMVANQRGQWLGRETVAKSEWWVANNERPHLVQISDTESPEHYRNKKISF
jgi:hypothetical protein